jgi:hypothetical protein
MAMSIPVGGLNSPKTARSESPHSPVLTPASAQRIELGMMFSPLLAASAETLQGGPNVGIVAVLAMRLQPLDLLTLGRRIGLHDGAIAAQGQRRFRRFLEAVHSDDLEIARLDGAQAVHVAADQFALDVAGLDRGNDPALGFDILDFPLAHLRSVP